MISVIIFKVSITRLVAVIWYKCLTCGVVFLTMVLSWLKNHVVASKQTKPHLISKVPSTNFSMRVGYCLSSIKLSGKII